MENERAADLSALQYNESKELSDIIQENANERLVHVAIIHRHGARGPNHSELHPFKPPEGENNLVLDEWKHEELDSLTNVGHQQCFRLGIWMRDFYFGQEHPDFNFIPTKWRSSISTRAFESGIDFTNGFEWAERKLENGERVTIENSTECIRYTDGIFSKEPLPYYTSSAEDVFRSWNINTRYKDYVKKLVHSKIFEEKAQENYEFIQSIHRKVGSTIDEGDMCKQLYNFTRFHLMCDAEAYWPNETEDDNTTKEKIKRNAFISTVNEDELNRIEELARWVWEMRFMKSPFGMEIGGPMLKDITNGIQSNNYNFQVYSGHDYSILSLLSALGLESYSIPAMGYACFLLIEVYDRNGVLFLKIILNPCPFLNNRNPSTDIHDNRIILMERRLDEVIALVSNIEVV